MSDFDIDILEQFADSLENERFSVHLLPIAFSQDGTITEQGIQMQWDHPKYGMLTEEKQFVPVLVKANQIHLLTIYVIERICQAYLIRHELRGDAFPPVALTLFSEHFRQKEWHYLFNKTETLLAIYHMPKDRLKITVIPTSLSKKKNWVSVSIEQLQISGYRIEMQT